MKRDDCVIICIIVLFISMLYLTPTLSSILSMMTSEHAYIMSGIKFALLATFGEVLGKRISSGNWNVKDFGVVPKAFVWFLLGILIKVGFIIFATGMPAVLKSFDLPTASIFNALSISIGLNLIFAPIFMTIHKITDMHISDFKGGLRSLIHPIDMAAKFSQVNWNMQYGFVFKKTIPFFWIPAHTITFLLPEAFQVIFAAILGVILGVILSIASTWNAPTLVPK